MQLQPPGLLTRPDASLSTNFPLNGPSLLRLSPLSPGSWTSLPNGPIPSLPRMKKPFFLPTTRKLRQGHIPTTLQVPTQVFFSFLCFSVGLPSTALRLLSGSQPLLRVQSRGCEQFPLETGQRVRIPPATLRGCFACTPPPSPQSAWTGSAPTSPAAPQPGPLLAGLMGEPERSDRVDCCH